MMEDLVPTDFGLAEFMAKLIDETFEAVVASQAEQEQRQRRLLEMSGLSLEEFASQVITDHEIERELARLFPSESEGQPHGIFPGARYQPQARDILETPAIRTMLGS